MSAAPCEAFAEELVAYLDGEQSESERTRLDAHLGACLTCRRELERLRRLRALIGELRPIEPSLEFTDALWRRLDAVAPRRTRRWRTVVWTATPLAAAAAVALAWYSSIAPAPRTGAPPQAGPAAVAVARHNDAVPNHATGATHDTQVAQEKPEETPERAPEAVAAADDQGGNLEQYPPELVEHPELFLRYPVVRRLDKLEHFEEVRQHTESEPVGSLAPALPAIG